MISLEGNQAAVMHVAKGGLNEVKGTMLERLQLAIAASAGLSKREWVEFGQVLQVVAQTHDVLTEAGLIRRPAQQLLESLRLMDIVRRGEAMQTPPAALLQGLMSNMTCMQMADAVARFVDWESGLVPGFADAVRRLAANEEASQEAV